MYRCPLMSFGRSSHMPSGRCRSKAVRIRCRRGKPYGFAPTHSYAVGGLAEQSYADTARKGQTVWFRSGALQVRADEIKLRGFAPAH